MTNFPSINLLFHLCLWVTGRFWRSAFSLDSLDVFHVLSLMFGSVIIQIPGRLSCWFSELDVNPRDKKKNVNHLSPLPLCQFPSASLMTLQPSVWFDTKLFRSCWVSPLWAVFSTTKQTSTEKIWYGNKQRNWANLNFINRLLFWKDTQKRNSHSLSADIISCSELMTSSLHCTYINIAQHRLLQYSC